jgi:uncharacterized membrane protein
MPLQYIPQKIKSRGFDRVAVVVTIVIAWAFAEILTAAGAYNKRPPMTQINCRTDRSGLITAASWSVLGCLIVFLKFIQCSQTMSLYNNILS